MQPGNETGKGRDNIGGTDSVGWGVKKIIPGLPLSSGSPPVSIFRAYSKNTSEFLPADFARKSAKNSILIPDKKKFFPAN